MGCSGRVGRSIQSPVLAVGGEARAGTPSYPALPQCSGSWSVGCEVLRSRYLVQEHHDYADKVEAMPICHQTRAQPWRVGGVASQSVHCSCTSYSLVYGTTVVRTVLQSAAPRPASPESQIFGVAIGHGLGFAAGPSEGHVYYRATQRKEKKKKGVGCNGEEKGGAIIAAAEEELPLPPCPSLTTSRFGKAGSATFSQLVAVYSCRNSAAPSAFAQFKYNIRTGKPCGPL